MLISCYQVLQEREVSLAKEKQVQENALRDVTKATDVEVAGLRLSERAGRLATREKRIAEDEAELLKRERDLAAREAKLETRREEVAEAESRNMHEFAARRRSVEQRELRAAELESRLAWFQDTGSGQKGSSSRRRPEQRQEPESEKAILQQRVMALFHQSPEEKATVEATKQPRPSAAPELVGMAGVQTPSVTCPGEAAASPKLTVENKVILEFLNVSYPCRLLSPGLSWTSPRPAACDSFVDGLNWKPCLHGQHRCRAASPSTVSDASQCSSRSMSKLVIAGKTYTSAGLPETPYRNNVATYRHNEGRTRPAQRYVANRISRPAHRRHTWYGGQKTAGVGSKVNSIAEWPVSGFPSAWGMGFRAPAGWLHQLHHLRLICPRAGLPAPPRSRDGGLHASRGQARLPRPVSAQAPQYAASTVRSQAGEPGWWQPHATSHVADASRSSGSRPRFIGRDVAQGAVVLCAAAQQHAATMPR
eukprot:s6261_g4.t2